MSLSIYRRHNPALCKSQDSMKCDDPRKPCPIWVSGTGPDGKFIRQSLQKVTGVITRDWRKAQEAVDAWEKHGKAPKPTIAVRPTIKQLKTDYLVKVEGENLNRETIRKYRTLFAQLDAFATEKGIRFVDELDYQTLLAFRATWTDRALAAGKKLERLRSVMAFAVSNEWIEKNPALDIKKPKVTWVDENGQEQKGDRPTLPYMDAEMLQLKQYVGAPGTEAYDPEAWAFILTMRFSGLAIQDTATLPIKALENGRLTLRRTKTGTPVTVKLPELVSDALLALAPKSATYFFWSGKGERRSAASVWGERLRTIFRKAKIEKKGQMLSHRLRDTFATKLLSHGTSVENVAMLLGNSPKMVWKHYAAWVPGRQQALDEQVENANGGHELLSSKPPAAVLPIKSRKRA